MTYDPRCLERETLLVVRPGRRIVRDLNHILIGRARPTGPPFQGSSRIRGILPALLRPRTLFVAFDVLHQDGTNRAAVARLQKAARIDHNGEASYENKFRRSGIAYLVLASTMLLPGSAGAAEIRVMLSGGFAAAYLELVPEFERATGHTVSTVRGGSTGTAPNSIPSRLQRGEPVDVVVLNATALDGLIKDGKIAAGMHVDLGRTHLAVAIRAGSPKPDIGSVDAFKRAMRSAKSIAYASNVRAYLFTELFPRLGIAD